MNFQVYFIIVGVGIVAILLFDAIGAIVSRKLDINYTQLSLISIFLYMLIGYFAALYLDTMAAVTITGLVGLLDTLVGWRIVKKLGANLGGEEEQALLEMTEPPVYMVIGVVIMSMGTGWLGALFA